MLPIYYTQLYKHDIQHMTWKLRPMHPGTQWGDSIPHWLWLVKLLFIYELLWCNRTWRIMKKGPIGLWPPTTYFHLSIIDWPSVPRIPHRPMPILQHPCPRLQASTWILCPGIAWTWMACNTLGSREWLVDHHHIQKVLHMEIKPKVQKPRRATKIANWAIFS